MCCWYSTVNEIMIKKTEYQQQSYRQIWLLYGGMIVVCIQFFNHKQWNTNNTCNKYYSCCAYIVYYGCFVTIENWLIVHIMMYRTLLIYKPCPITCYCLVCFLPLFHLSLSFCLTLKLFLNYINQSIPRTPFLLPAF